jgi:hypothetical protein
MRRSKTAEASQNILARYPPDSMFLGASPGVVNLYITTLYTVVPGDFPCLPIAVEAGGIRQAQ